MSVGDPTAPTPLTTDTRPQRRLTRLLTAVGFEVREEVSFPPYTVDCFVERLHTAFEADGPQHSATHDRRRDTLLLERYGLPVFRLTAAGAGYAQGGNLYILFFVVV